MEEKTNFLGTEAIPKIIFKLAPPMMFAFLVQAMYCIVDSLFVARYSESGLTALSIIYPIQLLLVAMATGTGSGINVITSRLLGEHNQNDAEKTAFHGIILGVINWIITTVICLSVIVPYLKISTCDPAVIHSGLSYGVIILIFSFGLYLESNCTKILQAVGNMTIPMIAQTCGALFNIVFDYLLIFGKFGFPELGIAGAAIATVAGQILAMLISFIGVMKCPSLKIKLWKIDFKLFLKIYHASLPNITMQILYTVYIFGLNIILATFSIAAVTVLGLYYKLQNFFFIPLFGLEHTILPMISYNYGMNQHKRIWQTLIYSCIISAISLSIGTLTFIIFPEFLLRLFSENAEILSIGKIAFPIIGLSFPFAAITLLLPVFFQAVGKNLESIFVTILRQIILFVPLAWILSKFGLNSVWLTFPFTEIFTLVGGIYLLLKYKKISQKV